MKLSSDVNFEEMIQLINTVNTNLKFKNVLRNYVSGGIVSLEMYDANFETYHWDGELIVKFKLNKIGIVPLVNNIIGVSRADEIELLDDETLRLWWD